MPTNNLTVRKAKESRMKNWRLQWLHEETGEWRAQLQNDDRSLFDEAVSRLVAVSKREGGWMDNKQWRIAEYEMRPVKTTAFPLSE
jgi:hypothetical protein